MTRRRVLVLGTVAAIGAVLSGIGQAEDRQRRYVIGVAGMT